MQDKSLDTNHIMTQILLIKSFLVCRIIIFIFLLAYFLGALWLILTKHTTANSDEHTFYNIYGLADLTNFESLWIVVYFMFTTLSTVGFGDFHPKSEIERIVMSFILLIGVACFSYIMSQFISIVLEV